MEELGCQRFVNFKSCVLAWGILTSFLTLNAAADHADLAIPGNHPLSPAQSGDLLIAERRCAACHSGVKQDLLFEKQAPDLADVGARISPEYLQRYLESPSATHPGTTMPDMLATWPADERSKIAEALTHFLVAQSKNPFESAATPSPDLERGKALFHSVGCVACHGPQEPLAPEPLAEENDDDEEYEDEEETAKGPTFRATKIGLGHVAAKYSRDSLSRFLFQPLLVRSSGRMPDMKLTPDESQAIARYLIGEDLPQVKTLVPQASLVAQGKQYFQDLNCAACHSLSGITAAAPAISLQGADLSGGCLSSKPGRNPQFQFQPAQIEAITAALRQQQAPATDQIVLAKTMTAFNCIACHSRSDFGGVHADYNAYFQSTEKNLGDEGRIPPPLTGVGAKLQSRWMQKVLFDGESVRSYMLTRMPKYGPANLHHVPDLFSRLDAQDYGEPIFSSLKGNSEAQREREKQLRSAGRELLGDKGLNCIACHNFNGKPSPGNQGIDLITSPQRLQPEWFNQFLRNPGAYRPRTVMPTAWPNGVATYKTILDGDTDSQIEAIWRYLSLGTSAADPPGIRQENTTLTADDHAKTYRGRSRVAGYRGIAVGFPEKLNYAFNAETGTLSAIWRGDFIRVNWSGQGSGDFHPASEPIQLAQDVSFVQLADEHAPWPLLPVMTKEAPINPDPLYPKNLGYQFRGYYLDESSAPTLMYRSNAIEIEDRSVAVESKGRLQLKRVLQFKSPAPQTVWFRALSGEIQTVSDREFRSGRLLLEIPQVETKLRPLSDNPQQSELLLRLQIPSGNSSVELIYVPTNK